MDAIRLPCNGPVLGIGVDLVSVSRIRGLLERQGERFLTRVFTPEERAYCAKFRDPSERYAARFAAKEAVAKAFSTGIGERLGWTSISVVSGKRGQPEIVLDESGRALLAEVGGTQVAISLSHSEDSAIAFAVVVG